MSGCNILKIQFLFWNFLPLSKLRKLISCTYSSTYFHIFQRHPAWPHLKVRNQKQVLVLSCNTAHFVAENHLRIIPLNSDAAADQKNKMVGGTWWVLSPVYYWKCDKRRSGFRWHINNWVAALRGDWHGSIVCISGTQLDAGVTGRGHKSGPGKDSICLGLPATSPALGSGEHTLSCSCPTCCMCNLLSMT